MDRAQQIRAWGAGLLLFVATLSAELAFAHMRAIEALGVICGAQPAAHCVWCPIGVGSALAGLLLLGQWLQEHRRLRPATSRPT